MGFVRVRDSELFEVAEKIFLKIDKPSSKPSLESKSLCLVGYPARSQQNQSLEAGPLGPIAMNVTAAGLTLVEASGADLSGCAGGPLFRADNSALLGLRRSGMSECHYLQEWCDFVDSCS